MTLIRILTVLAVAVAAVWLWQGGQWRPFASRITALAGQTATDPAPAAGSAVAGAPAAGITPPDHLVSWRDADGVMHFTRPADAPAGARQHLSGKAGTLADYEKELESRTGITAEHLYLAQQARLARAGQAGAGDAAATPTTVESADPAATATSQARELLRQRDAALEQIRTENAR